ncbi:MAG: FtsX-like permease family protein [Planctomycetes bacterium]|nr:FtsX-like permease family protein [Planctomycetota bacterium]
MLPYAFSWFLAIRYLLTRWVNVIGMVGIALAVWAMIVVIAVFSGFIAEARAGIEAASPHLLLTGMKRGTDFRALEPILGADPDVVATAPRLTHFAMLFPHGGRSVVKRTDATAAGTGNYVMLLGIDPDREDRVTGFRSWLDPSVRKYSERVDPRNYVIRDRQNPFQVSAELVARAAAELQGVAAGSDLLAARDGIILGMDRLIRGDEMQPGQRVDVVSARLQPTGDGFKVRSIKINAYLSGAYFTQHRLLAQSVCLIDIGVLRPYLDGGDPLDPAQLVTDVAVRLRDGADRAAVAKRLERALHDVCGGKLLDYEQQNATYLGAVNQERTLMKFVLFAVMLVAGFLIFATLYMMVSQKITDIGILTSLGATPGGVGTVFLLSGMVIGAIGCTIGVITGFLSAYYLNAINDRVRDWTGQELFPTNIYSLDRVPVDLDPRWMAQVAGLALLLSLLVAWLPARRAARQDPIKALTH